MKAVVKKVTMTVMMTIKKKKEQNRKKKIKRGKKIIDEFIPSFHFMNEQYIKCKYIEK